MKYLIPDVQGKHYLPLVKDSLFWQTEDPKYLSAVSERLGLDRIKAILDDIELQKGTLLDIGCNTGLMTFMAQNRGHRSTGVDNDIHQKVLGFTPVSSIDTARNLSGIYGLHPEFIKGDYLALINQQRCWDFVLYLSVWHHHLLGYGRSEFQRMSVSKAEDILRCVWAVANVALYFEIDGFLDEVLAAGWGQSRIASNLERVTGCRPTAIHISPDGWAHPRTLWRLEKTSVSRREECKEIPLGKSRRRNIGYAKAGVLRMSREANDWKSDEHPYGLDVRRQEILREGTVLRLLKQHTHEGVMRILDFDDEWVSVEYIDGYLYDNKDGWLPEHLRNQASWLDLFGRGDIPEQIADAVRFLHKIGVAHTDIIPANIMVTKAGRAKLIDLLSCVPLTPETEQLDNYLLRRLHDYQGVGTGDREENRRQWDENLIEVGKEIEALPEGQKVAIADEEQIRSALKVARVISPFPHHGGEYWGPPASDETAVSEVEKIRKEAFTYLVFAWPAFWWLDYYKEFHRYLRSNFRCVLENDRLVVFDLRTKISSAAISRSKKRVHVFHIRKTGGTAIKDALGSCLDAGIYQIVLHDHDFTLQDVPQGEKVIFFVRDPIKRFISGFYSRKRKGQPRYNFPWNEAEEIAFRHFSTPNELASALSSEDKDRRDLAENAMKGINHVNTSLWDWFGTETYFRSRLSDILFIGFQESLDENFSRLKTILSLPETAALSKDDTVTNKNPANLDKHLDEVAERNLMDWYKSDYDFLKLCKEIAWQIQENSGP